ncbi:MAG TPA: hypothetical protein VMQ81_04280, partial [Acidimicrobiia bacterium]|nr:hypothetical protein [Acidimicrobiia bacterium]
ERHAGLLRTRARVESQAATWAAEGETRGFLLPEGQMLQDARALLDHPGAPLGSREERLVRSSVEAAAARHRRRVLRWRAAAAAVAVALVAGVLVWDLFRRPHVGWFSAIVFRDGGPEGVGRVSAEQRARRWWTYEVERRGRLGRVERLAAVDSARRPTYYHDFQGFLSGYVSGGAIDLRDPRQTIGRESLWELDYEGAEISRLRALDRTGRTVYELEYKGRSAEDRRELTAEYTRDGIAAPQAESGAAVVKTRWREDGLLERVWYLDANGRSRPDRNLSWGLEVERVDPDGLPTRLASLGRDGLPTANRHGWARAELRYEGGLLSQADFFDAEGRPVLTGDGYARLRIERDPYGNPMVEHHDDEQGRPMPGVAEIRHAYDDASRLVESTFVNAAGRATVDETGVYGHRIEYTDEGDPRRLYVLGPDGGPMVETPFGFAGLHFEWAESRPGESGPRGLAALTYLDAEGAPAASFAEFSRYVSEAYKYDEEGRLIEIRYLDAQGATVPALVGYARALMRYDEHDNMVEQRYADERGLPTTDLGGCAFWRLEYDAHGNPEARRCFDREGKEAFGSFGAIWRTRYDDAGQPVEDRFFNHADKPTDAPLGCWVAELRDGARDQEDLERLLQMFLARVYDAAPRRRGSPLASRGDVPRARVRRGTPNWTMRGGRGS